MSEDSPPYRIGRPPEPKTRKRSKGIRIAVDVYEFLASIDGQTALIEAAIRKTPEYRAWAKQQQTKRHR